jgi:hydroxyacylglutathione hydrolase
LTPAEVRARGALVVDTRPLEPFAAGHLPGAVEIEFNLADLADRAALLLPAGTEVVVHAEPERTVAASVGLLEDAGLKVLGHLEGGLQAWRSAGYPVEPLRAMDVDELRARLPHLLLLDVREPYEFRHARIDGAVLLPSGDAWAGSPDPGGGRPVAVICSGHARAAFVASLLARRGLPAVLVRGGMYEWERRGYPTVRGV